ERKIIHAILSENEQIETHSEGRDPYRYIVIKPVRK
ncbi:TPA: R3H domain-containing nucleic acid-binding protein, partial [Listeria monocytogenes]